MVFIHFHNRLLWQAQLFFHRLLILIFSDIASALTGSLATDGSATMTGPIKATDGAVGAPGVTFSSAPTCGFYYVGVNQIGYSAAGVLSITFNANGTITFLKAVTFSASVSFTDATFSICGYFFSNHHF